MNLADGLERVRVGWWAGPEPDDPLAALTGWLLRAEVRARCPGLSPVLVHEGRASWCAPGFTGEPVLMGAAGPGPGPLDVLVLSGSPGDGGLELAEGAARVGALTVGVAPHAGWEMEPRTSVGPPFGVPEPLLLAARHLPGELLAARCAYLRVVEGLPMHYVLVEGGLLAPPEEGATGPEPSDLEAALAQLADVRGGHLPTAQAAHAPAASRGRVTGPPSPSRPPRSVPGGVAARLEVVSLEAGPLLAADPEVDVVLRERRAETEEGRYQPEDWPGQDERPRLSLRVTSPLDLAAAVAGAEVVVAAGGPMLALAWALGVPHAAIAPEGSTADAFVAWTGDASALLEEPKELLNATGHIFARRGRPPGLKRLEATVDQSLDEAAAALGRAVEEKAAVAPAGAGGGSGSEQELARRVHELEAVNDALRQRLAAERLRFGERSALLEKAANTSVESAIKAVRGQDVITRRRLEVAEKEMRRLQEETAVQQAELRAIHSTMTMRVLKPAREYYGRLRRAVR